MRSGAGRKGFRLLAVLARRPLWLLAMALSAVAWVAEAASLALAPVAVVATVRNAGRGAARCRGRPMAGGALQPAGTRGRRPGERRRRPHHGQRRPHSGHPPAAIEPHRARRRRDLPSRRWSSRMVVFSARRGQPSAGESIGGGDRGRRGASFCRHGCVHKRDRRPLCPLRCRRHPACGRERGAMADAGHGGLVPKPPAAGLQEGQRRHRLGRKRFRRLARAHRRRLRPLRAGRPEGCERRRAASAGIAVSLTGTALLVGGRSPGSASVSAGAAS